MMMTVPIGCALRPGEPGSSQGHGGLVVEVRDGGVVLPGPLAITAAEPVARFAEDLLEAVLARDLGSVHRWLLPWSEVIPPDRLNPLIERDPMDCLNLWLVSEPGGTLGAGGEMRPDMWTGAVLKVRDHGQRTVVYRITAYLGGRVWQGEWPD